MFPETAKPLRLIWEELEREKHPVIINADITYVYLHCGYSYLTLPLLSARRRKYLNAQVLKLLIEWLKKKHIHQSTVLSFTFLAYFNVMSHMIDIVNIILIHRLNYVVKMCFTCTFILLSEAFSTVKSFVLLLYWNLKDMYILPEASGSTSDALSSVSWTCTPVCHPFMTDEYTPLLFISPGHTVLCSWAKESLKEGKRGKGVILSKPLRPDPRASCCWGVVCPAWETAIVWLAPKDGGLLSAHLYGEGGLQGRVGEKFEFLLSYVTATGAVTKRRFDSSYMGRELDISSPWRLNVLRCINHNKSTHRHVSSVFHPGKFGVVRGRWIFQWEISRKIWSTSF